jgi:putative hydrolase of the HAD superfamily
MYLKKSCAPVWLFDLDNTLHDASHAIFPAIHQNMNACLAQVLGQNGQAASKERVNIVRESYLQRYGATLLGMMKHHAVAPAEFLATVHHMPDLANMIRAERGLAQLLKRLPGNKILLTNAPYHYSREVLRHLGLHRQFADHIAIESMWVHRQLRPKPSKALFRKLLARKGLEPSRCILVEDTQSALKAAKAVGIRTVWVTQYLKHSPALKHPSLRSAPYLDVRVKSVRQLPRQVPRLSR